MSSASGCYFDKQKSENQVRKIEASQPFLKLQLALFEEATRTTAFVATSDDPGNEKDKTKRFWQLYWGELALVEHGEVETAMIRYGELLNSKTYGLKMQKAALEIAHACREELAKSWKVDYWNLDTQQK